MPDSSNPASFSASCAAAGCCPYTERESPPAPSLARAGIKAVLPVTTLLPHLPAVYSPRPTAEFAFLRPRRNGQPHGVVYPQNRRFAPEKGGIWAVKQVCHPAAPASKPTSLSHVAATALSRTKRHRQRAGALGGVMAHQKSVAPCPTCLASAEPSAALVSQFKPAFTSPFQTARPTAEGESTVRLSIDSCGIFMSG